MGEYHHLVAHVIYGLLTQFNACPTYTTIQHRQFLEAPVSGSKGPAAQGTLIFLCAGSEEIFGNETVQSSLKAMGKATHYFGKGVGGGTRAKLVVNSLMGTMMVAFSESLVLAESVGLDGNKMLEVFR